MLAATARSLGADDPRTEQQRRSDLFADLLLGRLAYDHDTENEEGDAEGKEEVDAAEGDSIDDKTSEKDAPDEDSLPWTGATESEWLEVEHIDPDTGELLGTQLQRINPDGEPIGPTFGDTPARPATVINRPRTIRIGIVVPCASLLGATSSPAELADRSGFIPGSMLRDLIAESLDTDSRTEVLFTRLLTDNAVGSSISLNSAATPPTTRRSDQDPRRHLPLPHLHRSRRPLRSRSPPTRSRRRHVGNEHGSVLPPTPPRQDLRLACRAPRPRRHRLDHAHRRPLPMPRRTTVYRTSCVSGFLERSRRDERRFTARPTATLPGLAGTPAAAPSRDYIATSARRRPWHRTPFAFRCFRKGLGVDDRVAAKL
jgi:hypothetical protein